MLEITNENYPAWNDLIDAFIEKANSGYAISPTELVTAKFGFYQSVIGSSFQLRVDRKAKAQRVAFCQALLKVHLSKKRLQLLQEKPELADDLLERHYPLPAAIVDTVALSYLYKSTDFLFQPHLKLDLLEQIWFEINLDSNPYQDIALFCSLPTLLFLVEKLKLKNPNQAVIFLTIMLQFHELSLPQLERYYNWFKALPRPGQGAEKDDYKTLEDHFQQQFIDSKEGIDLLIKKQLNFLKLNDFDVIKTPVKVRSKLINEIRSSANSLQMG